MGQLERDIEKFQMKVVFIDPAYMAMYSLKISSEPTA